MIELQAGMAERVLDQTISRRTLIRRSGYVSLGIAAASFFGCDGGSDETANNQPAIPTSVRSGEASQVPTVRSNPTEIPTAQVTRPPSTVQPASSENGILELDGFRDWVEVSGDKLSFSDSKFTIMARVNLTGAASGDAIFAKGSEVEAYAFFARLTSCGGAIGGAIDGETFCSRLVIQQNAWVDAALSYDGKIGRFYVNGVTDQVPFEAKVPERSGLGFIGFSPKGLTNEDFGGKIDFVGIYNGSRSFDQIREDFADFNRRDYKVGEKQRQGLVALWTFDGNYQDSTSNKIDGLPKGEAKIINQ